MIFLLLGDSLCTSVLEAAAAHLTDHSELDANIVNPVSKQQILVQYLKASYLFSFCCKIWNLLRYGVCFACQILLMFYFAGEVGIVFVVA